MSYLLDANVFIQAKNLHYGLDFCPAFWQWLLDNHASGQVFSIDKVFDEIAAGADELSDWAEQHGNDLFRATDTAVAAQFGRVSAWVTGQRYEAAAINTFLQVADFYLIAHALAGGHTVVTHEVPADSTKRIKIPNVCAGLNLRFMTPYEMLRIEKARFVLGTMA
jgi:predicted nucleic acid-binding protein